MISRIATLTIILSTAGVMKAMDNQEPQLPSADGSVIIAIKGRMRFTADEVAAGRAGLFQAIRLSKQEAAVAQWKSLNYSDLFPATIAPAQSAKAPAKSSFWRPWACGFGTASTIVIGSFAAYKFFKR